jgi:hypothetical protein
MITISLYDFLSRGETNSRYTRDAPDFYKKIFGVVIWGEFIVTSNCGFAMIKKPHEPRWNDMSRVQVWIKKGDLVGATYGRIE